MAAHWRATTAGKRPQLGYFRKAGHSRSQPGSIGKPITPELHLAVKAKLDSLIADREWGKRLEAKDQTALKEFYLATTLLSADVAEKAA
jgi:hypothetical protein